MPGISNRNVATFIRKLALPQATVPRRRLHAAECPPHRSTQDDDIDPFRGDWDRLTCGFRSVVAER
jgi:Na+-transporting NADH:ubiquinone oxidoreductase subunit NqrF